MCVRTSEQIVDVPGPHFIEDITEVVDMSELIMDVPVPRVYQLRLEQFVILVQSQRADKTSGPRYPCHDANRSANGDGPRALALWPHGKSELCVWFEGVSHCLRRTVPWRGGGLFQPKLIGKEGRVFHNTSSAIYVSPGALWTFPDIFHVKVDLGF